jgi:hypothetical protein
MAEALFTRGMNLVPYFVPTAVQRAARSPTPMSELPSRRIQNTFVQRVPRYVPFTARRATFGGGFGRLPGGVTQPSLV